MVEREQKNTTDRVVLGMRWNHELVLRPQDSGRSGVGKKKKKVAEMFSR